MRGFLLASVSSAALAGTAMAADLPVKASPPPMPATQSWTGFYVGLDAGLIQHKASVTDPGFTEPTSSLTIDGVIGGGHVGYNWQYQQIVLGVEADFSGATGSGSGLFGSGFETFVSRLNWLSTFRARAGYTFDQWLLYGTAGWAIAGVHNTRIDTIGPFVVDQTNTMSGFVWGGGVERMFGQHWSGRIEALAVNLGDNTVQTIVPGNPPMGYTSHFTNKAVVARGGVSYKW